MKAALFSLLGIVCIFAALALATAAGYGLGYLAGLVGDLVRMVF